jgi:hypothetical protein
MFKKKSKPHEKVENLHCDHGKMDKGKFPTVPNECVVLSK